MKHIYKMFFLLVFLSVSSPAYSLVDLYLDSPDTVAVNRNSDVRVKASGTGIIAGAQIKIVFDNTKIQIKEAVSANSMITKDINAANAAGAFIVMYFDAAVTGIDATASPEFARITFNAIAVGQTQINIDKWSAVSDLENKDITGSRIPSVITVVGFSSVGGDIDGNEIVDLRDAILGLKAIAGMDVMVNSGADINHDKKIGIEEIVYMLRELRLND